MASSFLQIVSCHQCLHMQCWGDQLRAISRPGNHFRVYDGHGAAKGTKKCDQRIHTMVAEEDAMLQDRKRWSEVLNKSSTRLNDEVPAADKARSTSMEAIIGPRSTVVANDLGQLRLLTTRFHFSCQNGHSSFLVTQSKILDEMRRKELIWQGWLVDWKGYRVQGVVAGYHF